MLKTIDMTRIVSGKNIRNEHDNEIAELADSIEKQGLINPILVQALENGKFQIIAGHRRFEAVKRLGLPFIECNVIEYLSEKDRILTQIAENTQRKDMSAYELVKVFKAGVVSHQDYLVVGRLREHIVLVRKQRIELVNGNINKGILLYKHL